MFLFNWVDGAAPLKSEWLAEVMPQLCACKRQGDHRYDPTQDLVMETEHYFYAETRVTEKPAPSVDKVATARVFAQWLSIQTHCGEPNLSAVLAANTERQTQAQKLNTRAGENVFHVFSQTEVYELYASALSGATRIVEVSNPGALALPGLDEELVAIVVRENPEAINVLGAELEVEYRPASWSGPCPPRVRLTEEMVKAQAWLNLPDEGVRLPGGRAVEVTVFVSYNTVADTDIPRLKEKVRERLNQSQWEMWIKPAIALPDAASLEADIPEITIAQYGVCVITGEPLSAYGTIHQSSHYGLRWEEAWFRSREEAEKVRAEAVQKLEAIRAEAAAKAELEQVRAEAETARKELMGLSSREEWNDLHYELQRRVESRRYSYLPNSTPEVWAWIAETKALVAEAEAALAEVAARRAKEVAQLRAEGLKLQVLASPILLPAEEEGKDTVYGMPCADGVPCYPKDASIWVLYSWQGNYFGPHKGYRSKSTGTSFRALVAVYLGEEYVAPPASKASPLTTFTPVDKKYVRCDSCRGNVRRTELGDPPKCVHCGAVGVVEN